MQPYVLTVSSEKGGVGKTTLATNLAIYLKALNENLPVTLFSFDNHFSVDQMFRIGRSRKIGEENGRPSVLDLWQGRPGHELVETGEFGVSFIPSSRRLNEIRPKVKTPDLLARQLCRSSLAGIVIIDTRPDLDVFTQNALFAADRVIIPVKDAPSLENCRNIYDFFQQNGLSRRPLRILPCLVDSRIRFDGPFRDAYRLLKGYAINRGYRCLEGFIAKSPKVESLNTNPDGRIYPVLTHGRNTEVHLQFAHLARQVYLDFQDAGSRRLAEVADAERDSLSRRQVAFEDRRSRLQPTCLLCGRPVVAPQEIAPVGYYWEAFGGRGSGFIEEECFSNLLFSHFYTTRKDSSPTDPLRDLFRESAQDSYFAFVQTPHTRNFFRPQISYLRYDENGLEISHKQITLDEPSKSWPERHSSPLHRMLATALLEADGRLGDGILLVRRVSTDFPEEILYEENYASFASAGEKIAASLRPDEPARKKPELIEDIGVFGF